jgi:hypothetical protein
MTLIAYLMLAAFCAAILWALIEPVLCLLADSQRAGVHRYMHDDPVDPMRPADLRALRVDLAALEDRATFG